MGIVSDIVYAHNIRLQYNSTAFSYVFIHLYKAHFTYTNSNLRTFNDYTIQWMKKEDLVYYICIQHTDIYV